MYSKEIICLNNIFTYIIFLPFVHNPLISVVPWSYETQNKNSVFNKIHFDYLKRFKREILKLDINSLKKNFLKKKYKKTICIHLRDNYYEKSNTDRNVRIESLNKTIKFLLRKKFNVIRFINSRSTKLNLKNKNYSEYLISSDSDKLDQFLIMNSSKLVIGSQSGVLNYNLILKTPFLLTNAIPINNIMVIKKKDVYIFKKFKKKNKFLNIKEIIDKNYHINPEKILKNVEIIDNTETEILNATKEILKIKKFKVSKKLRKKYKLSIKKIGAFYTNAKLSNYFLSKNKKIIRK